jgi:predicted Zn-ribbon and HTH transcriptional regulator
MTPKCEECGFVSDFNYRVEGKIMCAHCRAIYWRRHA